MNPEIFLQRADGAAFDAGMRDEFRAHFLALDLAYEWEPYRFWVFDSEEQLTELLPHFLSRPLQPRMTPVNIAIAEEEVWVEMIGGVHACDLAHAFVVKVLSAHDDLVLKGDYDLDDINKKLGLT